MLFVSVIQLMPKREISMGPRYVLFDADHKPAKLSSECKLAVALLRSEITFGVPSFN
jgi:hypothetical protein